MNRRREHDVRPRLDCAIERNRPRPHVPIYIVALKSSGIMSSNPFCFFATSHWETDLSGTFCIENFSIKFKLNDVNE